MKNLFRILAVILFFLILLIAILFAVFRSSPVTTQTNSPSTSANPFGSTQPTTVSEQQVQVQNDFKSQIKNSDKINLQGSVVVMPYALQSWGDTNKGGEALLEYDESKGWVLISMGGGAWDLQSLLDEGVPESIANQLLQGQ